jgi:excisionase family DNA binding protein
VTEPKEKPTVEQLLLTPEQVAESLNLGRATVYDLMRMRLLPSVKIGRARRIPAAAVREYVERLTEEFV